MLHREGAAATIELSMDGSAPTSVPWPFEAVTGVRWCDERAELLVTGTMPGAAAPAVMANERGDRRLHVWSRENGWQAVGPNAYADDPVATRDSYVVSRGAGIRVVDARGTVTHELKQGQFNWGPPSLSLSPSCTRLAWVRWKGDNCKLSVLDLETFEATQFTPSLYGYAWLDDDTVLYYLGAGPKALDVRTGKSTSFAKERWGAVRTLGDEVWFTDEFNRELFRRTSSGTDAAWTAKRSLRARLTGTSSEKVSSFLPREGGSAWLQIDTYKGLTVVGRDERWVGPMAAAATGWTPLPGCSEPQFGFVLAF